MKELESLTTYKQLMGYSSYNQMDLVIGWNLIGLVCSQLFSSTSPIVYKLNYKSITIGWKSPSKTIEKMSILVIIVTCTYTFREPDHEIIPLS